MQLAAGRSGDPGHQLRLRSAAGPAQCGGYRASAFKTGHRPAPEIERADVVRRVPPLGEGTHAHVPFVAVGRSVRGVALARDSVPRGRARNTESVAASMKTTGGDLLMDARRVLSEIAGKYLEMHLGAGGPHSQ